MGRFITDVNRSQTTVFPRCVDDWIAEDIRFGQRMPLSLCSCLESLSLPVLRLLRRAAGDMLTYRYTDVDAGLDREPILSENLSEMSDQGSMHTGQGTGIADRLHSECQI